MPPRPLTRLALAFAVQDSTQFLGATLTTSLLLARVGVGGAALVQGAPLLALALTAPLVGLWFDGRPAGRALTLALAALSARALGFLWFDWRWYAALAALDLLLSPAIAAAHAGLMPALAAGRDLARITGRIGVLSNMARALGTLGGPLLAFHLGVAGFLVVSLGYLCAAALAAGLPPVPAGAAPHRGGPAGAPALVRGFREGLRAFAATPEDRRVIALLGLAGVSWGVLDVITLRVAEDGFGVPTRWTGAYAATSRAAEVAGSLLVGAGIAGGAAGMPRKVGLSATALGAALLGAGIARAPALGFALKFLEGLASVLTGMLGSIALVFCKGDAVRGRLAGLLATLLGLSGLAGKSLALWSDGRCSARALAAGAGAFVLTAALGVVALDAWPRGGRAPAAAREDGR